ncbi:hypothetical protein [uncultured Tenacibaculum sp.]|uniref:hypothetical protein n=1 Tax=uncultured Tenacibaculum sp. TaxID=174713 RepID=UPI002611CAB6|nr:hypothetical protein [uncultured Tenacibaculum sp.]
MKTTKNYVSYLFVLCVLCISCNDEILTENSEFTPTLLDRQNEKTDHQIAIHYAPVFFQDVDTTDGLCRNQSKSGSADWITAVNYDGDWNTKNNWENMVSGRDNGKLIPYVYYYVTYTKTHYFILYAVYHPRDWTDVPFLCSLDSHENDMEGILITADRKENGEFGDIINAQTIWHSSIYDYNKNEILLEDKQPQLYIEAKGHGMRAYQGSSDKDGSYIKYYYNGQPGVSPDKNSRNLPQNINYNLIALENSLWLQRNNPLTFAGASFVGDNGNGDNRANAPWGWKGGDICKNPAKFLKDKYNWTNFSTDYLSDLPIR